MLIYAALDTSAILLIYRSFCLYYPEVKDVRFLYYTWTSETEGAVIGVLVPLWY